MARRGAVYATFRRQNPDRKAALHPSANIAA